ncbi:MAG: helix-turn-helix transcriptional regulator [Desulfuromonadales bacterium]|nr:helix-turn-helix transcriptional regulator [Desulfuromonadales bacterium]
MNEEALQRSYKRFGLTPEASLREVELAFHKLRKLYSDNSLATYSLLEDGDLPVRLNSLQAAYDMILQSRLYSQSTPDQTFSERRQEDRREKESHIVVVDADPQQKPGLFLKQMREARGMSVHHVAERTKIGPHQLQCIEAQDFAALPAPVYLRGFLKEYCRTVKVQNSDQLVDAFMSLYSEAT